MKIKRLIIHNLASIEDAEIDFSARPLMGSDVFLICGSTGAGKTTILDAIALALYDDTPRLNNYQGGLQKIADPSNPDTEMGVSDTSQLMRRNTGETFVTLEFTGSNGFDYSITWERHRAHKKPNRALQDKQWALTKFIPGASDIVFTRDTDIKAELAQAIGLKFNEFCRTTMLAQGQFAKFLNCKDDEKSEILEKITGVQIYSRVGRKIFEKAKEKEDACRQIDDAIRAIDILGDEKVADLKQKIAAIEANVALESKKREEAAALLAWKATADSLASQLASAKSRLEQATEASESQQFKDTAKLIAQWKQTIDVRSAISQLATIAEDKAEKSRALETLTAEMLRCAAHACYLRVKIIGLQSSLSKAQTYLAQREDIKDVLLSAESVCDDIDDILGKRKRVKLLESDCKRLEKQCKEKQDLLENKLAEIQKATDIYNKENDTISELERHVAYKDLAKLRKELSDAKDRNNSLSTLRQKLSQLSDKKSEVESKRQALDKLQEEIALLKETLQQLQAKALRAEEYKKGCQQQYDAIKSVTDDATELLRAHLHDGEPCPVCGRIVDSSLPDAKELYDKYVEPRKRLLDEAEKSWEEAIKLLNHTNGSLEAKHKQLEADESRWAKDSGELEKLSEAFRREAKNLGLSGELDSEAIAKAMTTTDELIKELSLKVKEGDEIEALIKLHRQTATKQSAAIAKANSEKDTIIKQSSDASNKKTEATATLNSLKDTVATLEGKLLASLKSYYSGGLEKILQDEFKRRLREEAKEYQQMNSDAAALDKKINDFQNEANAISSSLRETSISSDTQPNEWQNTDVAKIAASSALQSASINGQIEDLTKREQLNKAAIDDFLQNNEDYTFETLLQLNQHTQLAIELDEKQLQEINSRLIQSRQAVATLCEQQSSHLKASTMENPLEYDFGSQKIIQSAADDNIKRLMAEKGSIDEQLKVNDGNIRRRDKLIADSKGKIEERDCWLRLREYFGDSAGKKFRNIAQSYILGQLIHSANHYLSRLMPRYRLSVEPGRFVIMVEDAYQNFASRAVSNISGGESFLVSLSLALALSDIGHGLGVDILFIDEGFGTLSGEALQKSVETLRTLHRADGRRVGIISHVEELKERIPVQIRVDLPPSSSASTVTVLTTTSID